MNQVHVCDACMGLLQETSRRHDHFSWAVLWTCPTCDKHFHCCDDSRCGARSVVALGSRRQLMRHNYNWHKKPRLEVMVDLLPVIEYTNKTWDMAEDISEARHRIPMDAYTIFAQHSPTKFFLQISVATPLMWLCSVLWHAPVTRMQT
jgi:hypothetical protein